MKKKTHTENAMLPWDSSEDIEAVVDETWLNECVKKEQIKLTYKQVPTLSISNIIAVPLIAFLIWDVVADKTLIYIWLTMNYSVTLVLTGIVMFFYNRIPDSEKDYSVWGKIVVVLGFLRATSWGSMSFLLYIPGSVVSLAIVSVAIIGGSSLIMFLVSAYKPAFYAVALPLLLPLIINVFMVQDAFHMTAAVVFAIYTIALVGHYKNIHNTVVDTLRLRFIQNRLLEELKKQKEQAEHANLAKSKFLAAASHDLRQPLHAQGMFLAELEAINDNTKLTPIIENLSLSVEAMRELFSELLDMSKLDAGIISPELETFALNDLFKDIELHFKEVALEKNINLKVRETNVHVTTDQYLLKRILWNLVSNAIRYTEHGKVLLAARKRGKMIRIETWDTGIGIPSTEIKQIFSEFYQLGNPERDRNKGMGLGLSIASRLAKLLGTQINVSSVIGRGSVFSFELQREMRATEQRVIDSIEVQLGINSKHHKILIIDDDATNLNAMGGLLGQWGYDVMAAIDIADAVSKVRESKPTLIIADYRLQGEDTGLQAISEINSLLEEDIPAFIVTGDTAPDKLKEVTSSGYKLIHKPVTPAKLRSMISYIDTVSNLKEKVASSVV